MNRKHASPDCRYGLAAQRLEALSLSAGSPSGLSRSGVSLWESLPLGAWVSEYFASAGLRWDCSHWVVAPWDGGPWPAGLSATTRLADSPSAATPMRAMALSWAITKRAGDRRKSFGDKERYHNACGCARRAERWHRAAPRGAGALPYARGRAAADARLGAGPRVDLRASG